MPKPTRCRWHWSTEIALATRDPRYLDDARATAAAVDADPCRWRRGGFAR